MILTIKPTFQNFCSGDLLTGAMELKKASQPTREIVAMCSHDYKVTINFLTTFKCGIYTFNTFFAAQEEIKQIKEPKKTFRDLAIKAVFFLQQ